MATTSRTYLDGAYATEKTFPDGGSLMKLKLKADRLRAFVDAHTDDKGYLRLVVSKRRQPSDKGETHTVYLDDWTPDPSKRRGSDKPEPSMATDLPDLSDIPFTWLLAVALTGLSWLA